jgi:hypothetical protein
MHVQSPVLSTPTSRRGPVLAAIATLVAAAGAAGGIALVTSGDDSSSSVGSPAPARVVPSSPGRVLDGSPILRGTVTPELDGSPILRGTSTPVQPSVANTAAAGKVAGYPRRPQGFHQLP